MEFLSNGFYKSTVHRVVQPPEDQRSLQRLAVFYFGMPDDDLILAPTSVGAEKSEVVARAEANGTKLKLRYGALENAPTMSEWRRGVTNGFGSKKLVESDEPGVQVFEVNGIAFKHYD